MTWGSDTRVVVYHSTIIHTLAIMGIFGMIAVIINWYIAKLVRKINLEKWIILVGLSHHKLRNDWYYPARSILYDYNYCSNNGNR